MLCIAPTMQLPPFSPFVFQLLGMVFLVSVLLPSVLCVGPHGGYGQPCEVHLSWCQAH